jgi:hypothetical protein
MNAESESEEAVNVLGREGLRLGWLEAGDSWVWVLGLRGSQVLRTVCSCPIENGFEM